MVWTSDSWYALEIGPQLCMKKKKLLLCFFHVPSNNWSIMFLRHSYWLASMILLYLLASSKNYFDWTRYIKLIATSSIIIKIKRLSGIHDLCMTYFVLIRLFIFVTRLSDYFGFYHPPSTVCIVDLGFK